MKVVFAGPSLYGATPKPHDIEIRPPAAHGDLLQAVIDGATAIGLVDGNFEAIASVWHKEILYALDQGVNVLGAASMGALRAAECAPFGMVPVGKIANEYASGKRDDDADVALCHGPIELGCPPTTLAMVDIEATVAKLVRAGYLKAKLANQLLDISQSIFFKERDINTVFSCFDETTHIKSLFMEHFTSQKQIDALELLDHVSQLPPKMPPNPLSFVMQTPHTWKLALGRAAAQV